MCPARGLTEFARKCITHITRDGIAAPVLLIVDESRPARSTFRAKLRKSVRLDGNLWHLQSTLFPPSRIPAYRTESLDRFLPGVERIACRPELRPPWSQYFQETDVREIQSRNLDFILKFAFGIIRGSILQAARYGIWSFHHGDEEKYRGGPPAFWEIHHSDPVTAAVLQRLTERLDGGVILKKCWIPTEGASYRANLQRIQECSWHLARWACLDVIQGRMETIEAPPSGTKAPVYRAPNDAQMLRFWWKLGRNWIRKKLANQRVDEWNVGLVNRPQSAFLDPEFTPRIEWFPYSKPGQMIADPFLMPSGDPKRVLVEEFNWHTERGRISELRRTATRLEVAPVIDEGIHMSYPYVFAHEGGLYAIPECAQSNSVLLYRLDPQTGIWRREAVLIDGVEAVDATVFQWDGRWWLMHSGVSGCGPWSLYVWYAPSLLGPWTPHVANPVKTDVSGSRPAGNPFWHEGRLYRPAQDGRASYGGALCIQRIDELTPEAFRETPVRRIAPDPHGPYPDGLHTLSGCGGLTMVDGKRHTWPLGLLLRRQLTKRLGLPPRGFS
jgi:hypothetical protein